MLLKERLRILTFPQRITETHLELNALLLPTQRALNDLAAFPSRQNPGTFVDLPEFITADLKLQVKTIKGLSTYPFSSEVVLHNEGTQSDSKSTDLAFPRNLPALYEGLTQQFEI